MHGKKGGSAMERETERIFYLEDRPLRVPYAYDEAAGRSFAQLPDLEETPVYTGAGRRCVTAVQDACGYGRAAPGGREPCVDCGSCRFYRPATPERLMGVCAHQGNQKKQAGPRAGGNGQRPDPASGSQGGTLK